MQRALEADKVYICQNAMSTPDMSFFLYMH